MYLRCAVILSHSSWSLLPQAPTQDVSEVKAEMRESELVFDTAKKHKLLAHQKLKNIKTF